MRKENDCQKMFVNSGREKGTSIGAPINILFAVVFSFLVFSCLSPAAALADAGSLGFRLGYVDAGVDLDGVSSVFDYSSWDGAFALGVEYDMKIDKNAVGRGGLLYAGNMGGGINYYSGTIDAESEINPPAVATYDVDIVSDAEIDHFVVLYYDVLIPFQLSEKLSRSKGFGLYVGGGLSYSIIKADQEILICTTEQDPLAVEDCGAQMSSMDKNVFDFALVSGYSASNGLDGNLKYFFRTKMFALSLGYHF
jgi:hypothetical protein